MGARAPARERLGALDGAVPRELRVQRVETDDAAVAQQFLDVTLALETGRDAYTVHVRPELVVEIAFDGVQTSPRYPGGMALRFARVKRHRPDKSAAEADTVDTVRAIHPPGGPVPEDGS